jgi:hypothetical protein
MRAYLSSKMLYRGFLRISVGIWLETKARIAPMR